MEEGEEEGKKDADVYDVSYQKKNLRSLMK